MKRKLLLSGIFFLVAVISRSGQLALNWTSESGLVKTTYAAQAGEGTGKRNEGIKKEEIKKEEVIRKWLDKLPNEKRRELEEALDKAFGRKDFLDLFDRYLENKPKAEFPKLIEEIQIHRILDEEFQKLRIEKRTPSNLRNWTPTPGLADIQVLLASRGLYKGKVDGISGPETRRAISEFQAKEHIPVNGEIDARTKEALKADCDLLMKQFRKIGFEASTLETAKEQYKNFYGIGKMTSGSYSQKVPAYVEQDLRCYNDVLDVYRGRPAPERIRAHEITWNQEQEMVAHALVMGADGVWEDWALTESSKWIDLRTRKVTIQRTRGKEAIDRWDSIFTEKVKENSDEVTAFFRMHPSRDETDRVDIIGKESVTISKSEIDNLLVGTGNIQKLDAFLKERSSSKQLVFWMDPLATPADREATLRVVEAIDSRYGDLKKVFLDDNLEIGKKNAKNLPSISGPTDVAVYIPRDGFNVQDYSVLEEIEPYLNQAQMKTVGDTRIVEASNIIIITGHKDEALRNYIMELGRKGCLQDKWILMLSCYEQGDTAFNSKVIKEFGIRGINFFGDSINPQAVQEVVIAIPDVLKKMPGSVSDLKDLQKKAVDHALEKNKSGPARLLLPEIEKLKKGLTQISSLRGLYQEYNASPYA
jgi:hypothetical protein